MNYKKFFYKSIISILVILVAIGTLVVAVDPQFHYHEPLDTLEYNLHNQRYQNDGIAKNFDYNAIITGTSMTENFKTSEMDSLFKTQSIKVSYNGANFKEIDERIKSGIKANKNIKFVLRSFDRDRILRDKDSMYHSSYPDYLYDDKYLNDVEYLFNKDTVFNYLLTNTLMYTQEGKKTTTFDEYSNWNDKYTFSKKAAMKSYKRKDKRDKSLGGLTAEDRKTIEANIEQNILSTARANPQIDFYLFLPPYSILNYDREYMAGSLQKTQEAEKYAVKMLLGQENIKLFAFTDRFDMVTNLNNYKDRVHYHEGINSLILKSMSTGESRLTADNYEEYYKKTDDFYLNYKYDAMFK